MNNIKKNPFSELFKYTSICLVLSLIGFIFGQIFIPTSLARLGNMFLGLFFLITFIASFLLKKGYRQFWTMNKTYLFAFVHGICIYPVINYYAYSLGITTVISVFIGTIALFLGLSLYGKNTKNDKILELGPVLSMILLGIIISSFINIFLKSNTFNIVISAVAIVLFAIYIIHSVNGFKHQLNYRSFHSADDYAPFVINLYTDFMNLFLNILSFLDSVNRNRD